MNAKHDKTLARVFKSPVPSDLKWRDIEQLLLSLGADIEERAGSRIVVKLNNQAQVFHRPHPNPDTNKGAVLSVRRFLEKAGIR